MFFVFVCKQKTAYEMRISDWSSDVCSSDLISLLQVAANPYVVVVGAPETASSRLNLVQAMNSAGTMLAPMFGAYLILGRSKGGTAQGEVVLTQAERLADAQSVILPYGLVAKIGRTSWRERTCQYG